MTIDKVRRREKAKSRKWYQMTFDNAILEDDYQIYLYRSYKPYWIGIYIVGFLLFLIYYVLNILLKPSSFQNEPDCLLDSSKCRIYRIEIDLILFFGTVLLPFAVTSPVIFRQRLMIKFKDWIASAIVIDLCVLNLVLSEYGNGSKEATEVLLPLIICNICGHLFLAISFKFSIFTSVFIALCFTVSQMLHVATKEASGLLYSLFYLYLLTAMIIFISYQNERSHRSQFEHGFLINEKNQILEKKIILLRNHQMTTEFINAPVDDAAKNLKILLEDKSINAEYGELLKNTLKILASPELMRPQIENQDFGDAAEWITSQTGQENTNRFSQGYNIRKSVSERKLSEFSAGLSRLVESKGLPGLDELHALSETVDVWDFDIFKFGARFNHSPLIVLSMHLLVHSGLFTKFSMNPEKFYNFITEIDAGYHPENAYHNQFHAADVLQASHALLQTAKKKISDMEVFILYFSAIIHDFDHPGVNNDFLIKTRDEIALKYNDNSVLENHHVSSALSVLAKPQNNFLEAMTSEEFHTIRKTVISLVLSTDLSCHFSFVADLKRTEARDEGPITIDSNTTFMKAVLKCADISNPARNRSVACIWASRYMEESFKQGESEKLFGFPVTKFMDGEHPQMAHCQAGFIEYLVKPLFEVYGDYEDIDEQKNHIRSNLEYWREKRAEE